MSSLVPAAHVVAIAVALVSTACGPRKAVLLRSPSLEPLSAVAYEHYLRGRVALVESDYDRAARELALAAAAAPDEAPIAAAYAESLYRAGRIKRALSVIEAAQGRWPRHAQVWQVSGSIYRKVAKRGRAVRAFQRAIRLEPTREATYLKLASTWIMLGRPGRAEKVYRKLLKVHRHSVAGHYRLGVRLLARGALSAAEKRFRKTISLKPGHQKARVALAKALRQSGNRRAALKVLQQAFNRSGGDMSLGKKLIRELLELGDRDEAVTMLKTLNDSELSDLTRVSIGNLFLQLGEPTLALQLSRALLETGSSSSRARELEARALIALRRGHEAIPRLLETPASSRFYPEARALAAEQLARKGDSKRAYAVVSEALGHHPENVDLLIARATVHERAADPERARAAFAEALEGHSSSSELLYALGAFEDRQKNRDRAIGLMTRILEMEPENVSAMNFIAYSFVDRGVELDRAERLLTRALELAPADGYILDSYGWLLFRRKRYQEAEAVLERARRLVPGDPEILWHLAVLAELKQDYERAKRLLRKARSLDPERPLAERIDARLRAIDGK